jgi:hypothetical protein
MKAGIKCLFLCFLISFFTSCENTASIGGYAVTFNQSPDTIPGLSIGLYKSINGSNAESIWTDFELIAEAVTDERGYFTMSFDEDIQVAGAHFFVRQTTDTALICSSYINSFSANKRTTDYSLSNNRAQFEPSVMYRFVFENFDFDTNLISIVSDQHQNIGYYPGTTYKLKVFKRIGISQEELLGEVEKYFPIVLPVKSDKIIWDRPLVEIIIDKNELK